ncbi:TPA: hypothetical protein DDW35_01520 [Candidatus Sumerlaeota bacterium]|jgi:hypothetical protein|nr:hypothetical protein [Candidatus Sumerlaeota bacterium]
MFCVHCGKQIADAAVLCVGCGCPVTPLNSLETTGSLGEEDALTFVRRVADYEMISAILWLVLAIFQIFSIVGAIAGLWNLFAAFSRFAIVKRIRQRDASVPAAYESMTQLIIIGVINLFLGGVIGIVFVAFDFFIRDQILKNKQVFFDKPLSFSN